MQKSGMLLDASAKMLQAPIQCHLQSLRGEEVTYLTRHVQDLCAEIYSADKRNKRPKSGYIKTAMLTEQKT